MLEWSCTSWKLSVDMQWCSYDILELLYKYKYWHWELSHPITPFKVSQYTNGNSRIQNSRNTSSQMFLYTLYVCVYADMSASFYTDGS